MPGARYGPLPVTGTGQLSVPDQKPVGTWRTGAAEVPVLVGTGSAGLVCVLVPVRTGLVAVRTGLVAVAVSAQPVASRTAAHPASASHDRFTTPPATSDPLTL